MLIRDEAGRFTYGAETVTKRGYALVYEPEHKHAKGNGYVFEHIIVAEKLLGRPLKDKEVVHHIDGDKRNNNPCNIAIFNSQSEHMRFHWSQKSKRYQYRDMAFTLQELATVSGVPYWKIYQRVKKLGWSIDRAIVP